MTSKTPQAPLTFVDLFSGLGGFHLALKRLGHTCVFASELNEVLRDVYERNHGLRPEGDITKVPVSTIPAHDILCAGFPCQPFSKAGGQAGFEHPVWGKLFHNVLSIITHHRPKYVMLKNVPNLENHDQGNTWAEIRSLLTPPLQSCSISSGRCGLGAGFDEHERRGDYENHQG